MLSEQTLLQKAGEAQVAAGTSKPEWQVYEERKLGVDRAGNTMTYNAPVPPYGDDPRDQEMIKQGFNYYNKNQENLDEED